jgi:hypothetical protein
MRTRSLRLLGIAVSALALPALAGPAAAEFGPTRTLRTADFVLLQDVAAKGSGIGVVWEEQASGTPVVRYRMSQDRGATWTATRRLDDRPNRDAEAAVCQGTLWIASKLRLDGDPTGDWHVVVDGKDLDGSGDAGYPITDSFVSLTVRDPSITCIGDRFLAVTWLEKRTGEGWRAWLRVFDPNPPIVPIAPVGSFEATVDLGPAARDVHPSMDATSGRLVVTWGAGGELRFKRFDVAPGGSVALSGFATQTVASNPGWTTAVAIAGSRVVLAYSRNNDLFTRRSTNGGASFSSAVKRLDGEPTCCFIAYPESVDIVGSKVLLLAGKAYGDLDPFVEEWRFRSTDGGASFTRKKVGERGTRMGAWSGSANAPRAVEAWDDWTDHEGDNHIRFHRES